MNTDRVAEGHCKGEGAGGGCAPSCTEREAETTSILQSEWEAKKRSIATYGYRFIANELLCFYSIILLFQLDFHDGICVPMHQDHCQSTQSLLCH